MNWTKSRSTVQNKGRVLNFRWGTRSRWLMVRNSAKRDHASYMSRLDMSPDMRPDHTDQTYSCPRDLQSLGRPVGRLFFSMTKWVILLYAYTDYIIHSFINFLLNLHINRTKHSFNYLFSWNLRFNIVVFTTEEIKILLRLTYLGYQFVYSCNGVVKFWKKIFFSLYW